MEITAAMIPGVNIVRSKLNVISNSRNLRTKGTNFIIIFAEAIGLLTNS